ncbi:DUF4913 domain-containing protein [Kitasatospora sp. NBC_01287]|uniref:DUF4913 domain-containing protein n=1 Tax=Kitasatospora sp. NBC_01287 TaxID=2903573 RepID=UPI00225A7AB3|nr:DUF4913 domain-containing protein [Kitasatospora sp. NBC_01287]MCX4751249.1 DUF4913 domain-containing protein [Kitasatospora sp. NBC_01287]
MSDPTTGAPEPDPTTGTEPEPIRIPDEDLDDLASALARTIAEVRQHGVILDRLGSDPEPPTAPEAGEPGTEPTAPEAESPASVFILALGGAEYAAELVGLGNWVTHILLPAYGREISSGRPWCSLWYEHPEAVARLHALWLAWQQLTDAEAGLSGPSTWHRDHLDHALLQLRSADGPFAACTTSPSRPNHRVLASPGQLGLAA